MKEAVIAAEREAIRKEARRFRWRLTGGYAFFALFCVFYWPWLLTVAAIWLLNLLWIYRVERTELDKLDM